VAAQIHGNTRLQLAWTVGAALILVVLTVVTFIKLGASVIVVSRRQRLSHGPPACRHHSRPVGGCDRRRAASAGRARVGWRINASAASNRWRAMVAARIVEPKPT